MEFLSVKILLKDMARAPEAVSISELDDAITWLLVNEKRYPGFAGAVRQMNKLRQHLLAGEFRQVRSCARLAFDFLG